MVFARARKAALRSQEPQDNAKRQYQSADEAVVGDRGLIVFARDAHPVARDGGNRGEP
jgi:hypothetical protein